VQNNGFKLLFPSRRQSRQRIRPACQCHPRLPPRLCSCDRGERTKPRFHLSSCMRFRLWKKQPALASHWQSRRSVPSTASLPALAGQVADALGLCLASSSSITAKSLHRCPARGRMRRGSTAHCALGSSSSPPGCRSCLVVQFLPDIRATHTLPFLIEF